ncbi:MAG: response regulator transcription factor [Campylobacterota bacterium]|nr:response regulator transcription factor [Campylobacterota bacterium]
MQNTILVVEDEQDILELIEYTLAKDKHDIIGCLDTSNVKHILEQENIDLILMDRNLPGIEGSVFIQSIREEGYTQPVIYISAKDTDDEILEGFNRGGDDYITKPFNLELLRARVKAILNRTKKNIDILKVNDIVYKSTKKRFYIDERELELTQLEHDLLLEFIKNRDILLTRESLLSSVWPDNIETKTKTVNVAVKRLKEKIDPSGKKEYIKSVRGEGYIFC